MSNWATDVAVVVTLDGVDVSSYVIARSLYVRGQVGADTTLASFELRDPDLSLGPGGWDVVTIDVDGARVFGGFVVDREISAVDGVGESRWAIECKDWSLLLDTVVVDKRYSAFEEAGTWYAWSDLGVLQDLFETYLPGEGFDVSTHVTSQSAVTELAFDEVSLREALNTLAAVVQADWYIAPDMSLYWFDPASPGNAVFDVDAVTPDWSTRFPPLRGSLRRSVDELGIVNDVRVLGGYYETRGEVAVLDIAAGQSTYAVPKKIKDVTQIRVNDGSEWLSGGGPNVRLGYVGRDTLIEDGGEAWFLVDMTTSAVKIDASILATLSGGDTLEVMYTSLTRYEATAEDAASIATYGRRFHRTYFDESINTSVGPGAFADAVLAEYAFGRETVRFTVAQPGLVAGRLVTLTLPAGDVGGDVLLLREQGGVLGEEDGDGLATELSAAPRDYLIQQVEYRPVATGNGAFVVVCQEVAGYFQDTLIEAMTRLSGSGSGGGVGAGSLPAMRYPGDLSSVSNSLGEIVAGRLTLTDGGTAPLSWADYAGHSGVVVGLDTSAGSVLRGNFLLLEQGAVRAQVGWLDGLPAVGTVTPTGWGLYTVNGFFQGQVAASRISGGTISAAQLLGGTVTGGLVQGGTVTGGVVSGGTVLGARISGGTVTGALVSAAQVQGGTVTGARVSGGTVTGALVEASLFSGGTINTVAGSIGGWQLANGTIFSGSVFLDAGNKAIYAGNAISGNGAGFAAGATSFADVAWWVGAPLAGRGTAPVRAYYGGSVVAEAGLIGGVTVAANKIYTSNGTIATGAVVNAANPGVMMSTAGLFGYGTLGLTFALYSDPARAPWVSSGAINNVVYEVYEAGVLRTSADPWADGGVQIDNSGIFGISAETGGGMLLAEDGDYLAAENGLWLELAQSGVNFSVDTATGRLSANEAWVRGTVFADGGVFSGTVFASAGEFSGTVNASAGVFTGTVNAAVITASEMSGGTVSGAVVTGGTVRTADGNTQLRSDGLRLALGTATTNQVRWVDGSAATGYVGQQADAGAFSMRMIAGDVGGSAGVVEVIAQGTAGGYTTESAVLLDPRGNLGSGSEKGHIWIHPNNASDTKRGTVLISGERVRVSHDLSVGGTMLPGVLGRGNWSLAGTVYPTADFKLGGPLVWTSPQPLASSAVPLSHMWLRDGAAGGSAMLFQVDSHWVDLNANVAAAGTVRGDVEVYSPAMALETVSGPVRLRAGVGAPSSGLGNNGDVYFDLGGDNTNFMYHKSGGSWVQLSTS